MADPEKLVVAGLLAFFLGGSFLAAVRVVDARLLPVAGLIYLLLGVVFASRLYRARKE